MCDLRTNIPRVLVLIASQVATSLYMFHRGLGAQQQNRVASVLCHCLCSRLSLSDGGQAPFQRLPCELECAPASTMGSTRLLGVTCGCPGPGLLRWGVVSRTLRGGVILGSRRSTDHWGSFIGLSCGTACAGQRLKTRSLRFVHEPCPFP